MTDVPAEKNQMAVELGRRGGHKGGTARAANMTSQERSEAARSAAEARWGHTMRKLTAGDHAKAMAFAHTDLTVFHAVINILEGGCLYTRHGQRDAQRIIDQCKAAADKQLRQMDHHMAVLKNA